MRMRSCARLKMSASKARIRAPLTANSFHLASRRHCSCLIRVRYSPACDCRKGDAEIKFGCHLLSQVSGDLHAANHRSSLIAAFCGVIVSCLALLNAGSSAKWWEHQLIGFVVVLAEDRVYMSTFRIAHNNARLDASISTTKRCDGCDHFAFGLQLIVMGGGF